MKERTKLLWIVGGFLAAFYIPWSHPIIRQSGLEAFLMLQEYAREHVLTCLIPAFFIAGAISVFVSQASVLKYFGAKANKILSYSVASVSGTILAVCSCTVLPLFAGIYVRGAGVGPATAFLYSGPAINVLAISLTAKILGWQLGLARAVGAIVFSVLTGLLMAFIFKKDDAALEDDVQPPPGAAGHDDLLGREGGPPLLREEGGDVGPNVRVPRVRHVPVNPGRGVLDEIPEDLPEAFRRLQEGVSQGEVEDGIGAELLLQRLPFLEHLPDPRCLLDLGLHTAGNRHGWTPPEKEIGADPGDRYNLVPVA